MPEGRLLILDDDPVVAQILVFIANGMGMATTLTDDPQQFLSMLIDWQPTHVAIDLRMPRMSGQEVLSAMAATGSQARVIVTSGADAGELNAALHEAQALGLQTAGILPKPFKPPTLRALLTAGDAP
jgi:CheY-like chemotaxis protein